MSMLDLQQAFQLIENNLDKSDFELESKSEELIQKAEQILGFKFPLTYRTFLKTYGCGDISGLEIYGIINDDFIKSSIPDAIWETLNKRKTGCPHSFVIIASTGFGPKYVLDSFQPDQDGEYPVLLWHCGDPLNTTERINNDFGEFLLEQVQQALLEDDEQR